MLLLANPACLHQENYFIVIGQSGPPVVWPASVVFHDWNGSVTMANLCPCFCICFILLHFLFCTGVSVHGVLFFLIFVFFIWSSCTFLGF